MKTVRTRVKTALKRNSKGTPAAPSVPVQLPVASRSAPSILPEKVNKEASTPILNEKDQPYSGFRMESEPAPIVNDKHDRPDELDLTGLKFTGDEPVHVYAPPQPIVITDDSRRSTPKKRTQSVPRVSSDYRFPSPSIASRIQITLPPTNDKDVSDVKFVSPVDTNYLIDDTRGSVPSLLDQPAPTDSSFVELTPQEIPPALPPLHEILAHQAHLKRLDSDIEVPRITSDHDTHEEDKPLLDSSLLTAEVDDILDSVWPLPPRTFSSLGWTEHVLPSSSYYYSHAATRTVTDIDLREEKKLAAVRSYLQSKGTRGNGESIDAAGNDANTIRHDKAESTLRIEEGIDLWLRDVSPVLSTKGTSDWEFMPMRNWVLHATRAVTFDPPSEFQPVDDLSDEDRLDLENRYWQYMSTHPAHASLPQAAYDEAAEVLTWCYTDQVFQSQQPLPFPPPFTQKECVTLLELLRNVTASSASTSGHVVRTRVIAQILLRYTEWRQKYVTKSPLEKLANTLSRKAINKVEHALPFRRTFFHFIKAVLCLGIPYLFESQDRESWVSDRHTDEEDQARTRDQKSLETVLGNSQPLVAALLLSSSVTLLVLPDLNDTSRTAALISALCSASSLVSFVITFHAKHYRLRMHKNQTGHSLAILVSLPFVMLAYSLCAFMVGVIAYSVAGTATTSRGSGGFGRYTGWVVIAVWIALVAVLAASAASTKKGL